MKNEHKHELKVAADCISIIRGTIVEVMNYEDNYREFTDLNRDKFLHSARVSRMLDEIQADLYNICCKIKEVNRC